MIGFLEAVEHHSQGSLAVSAAAAKTGKQKRQPKLPFRVLPA